MDFFPAAIGQQKVKNTLTFHLQSYQKTGVLDPLLFTAEKGIGKTYFSHQVGKALEKDMEEYNGGTIKTDKQFINQILAPAIGHKRTIFIDEIHAIGDKVANILLSVFNTTDDVSEILFEDQRLVIDFREITFLFATTEKHRVFEPLVDRTTLITFDEYTPKEVGAIIQMNTKASVDPDALIALAPYCRGNARSARHMGRGIQKYATVHDLNNFDANNVDDLVETLGIFPLGLNQGEVNMLKYVAAAGGQGITLTGLTAKSGHTAQANRAVEKYLLKHSLINIEGKRFITQKGANYLKEIERTGR